jgi:hypothetical protein
MPKLSLLFGTTVLKECSGQPVTGRHELKDGAVLTLGRVHMQFHLVAW